MIARTRRSRRRAAVGPAGLWLALTLALSVTLSGCEAQTLDSFLYKRDRVAQYDLDPEGDTPEETVTADRLEVLELRVNDEVTLGAAWVTANVSPPRGYVLYFHGQCCNLNSHIDRAKRLSNLGYDVLAFDYRGWGTSTDVAPDERGLLEDSRAALAYLEERSGVPRERLTYYGRSFGVAVATQLAEVEDPAVLIGESGFASIERFKEDSTRMDFPASYVSEGEWDNVARIRGTTAAVLLLHGTADDFVRPEFSQEIYDAANDPKQLVLVDGADHGNVPDLLGDDYGAILHDWVDAHTPPAP